MASTITSLGRFSSQMVSMLGAQRIVKNVSGINVNTFSNNVGPSTFIPADSLQQSNLGNLVVGNFSSDSYDRTLCYFLSRGLSNTYATTMAAITIDIASLMGISVQQVLENNELNGQLQLSDIAYQAMNSLRDQGNQTGSMTVPQNKKSYKSREILP